MSAKRQAKKKIALITEIIQLLRETGCISDAAKEDKYKKAVVFNDGNTLTYSPKTTNLTFTKGIPGKFSQFPFFLTNTSYFLRLTDLSLEKLLELKAQCNAFITEQNTTSQGVCAQNQVIHYLNHLKRPLKKIDTDALVDDLKNLRQLEQNATPNNLDQRTELATKLAETARELAAKKRSYRVIAGLIISAIAATCLVLIPISPVVGLILAIAQIIVGDKPRKKEPEPLYIEKILDDQSILSKASKTITLFAQQVQKPARSDEPALNPGGLLKPQKAS